MSIKPETLAWLRQTAAVDGAAYSQILLDLLERVEGLGADATEQSQSSSFCNEAIVRRLEKLEAAQQPHQDKLDRLIALDRGDQVGQLTPEAAPVPTDKELLNLWHKFMNYNESLRAVYNLGRQHGAAQPAPSVESAADRVLVNCPETAWVEIRRIADGKVIYNNHQKGELEIPVSEPPAAPAGGLVERVAGVWNYGQPLHPAACRAAIRKVAAWLDERGMHGCALWLREEVDR